MNCLSCGHSIKFDKDKGYWYHDTTTPRHIPVIPQWFDQPPFQQTYQETQVTVNKGLLEDALRVCHVLLDYIEEEIDNIPEKGFTSKLLKEAMYKEKKMTLEVQKQLKEALK